MKFTPGPWKLWKHMIIAITDKTQFTKTGVKGYRADICKIDYDPDMTTSTTDANARLIAASPDLYVAVRDLIDDVRRRYPGEELKCQFMIALDTALKKADGDL